MGCNCGCIPLTPGHPTSTCDAGVKYYYIIFKRFVCVVLGALLARRGVAWRSSSAAFLLVPLLPSTFLVYGLPLRPGFSFFFSFVFFFVSGICSFHFHWASSLSVIGAMGGAGREGARG